MPYKHRGVCCLLFRGGHKRRRSQFILTVPAAKRQVVLLEHDHPNRAVWRRHVGDMLACTAATSTL